MVPEYFDTLHFTLGLTKTSLETDLKNKRGVFLHPLKLTERLNLAINIS
jgi:hypothetical protein